MINDLGRVSWLKKYFLADTASFFTGLALQVSAVYDYATSEGYTDLWNQITVISFGVVLQTVPNLIGKIVSKKFNVQE